MQNASSKNIKTLIFQLSSFRFLDFPLRKLLSTCILWKSENTIFLILCLFPFRNLTFCIGPFSSYFWHYGRRKSETQIFHDFLFFLSSFLLSILAFVHWILVVWNAKVGKSSFHDFEFLLSTLSHPHFFSEPSMCLHNYYEPYVLDPLQNFSQP